MTLWQRAYEPRPPGSYGWHKCILQVRGVRPFFSDKVDITANEMYKELSDFDKKNQFDIEKYVSEYGKPKFSKII